MGTLSPVDDLGQDKKDAGENGDTNGKEVEEKKFDELELRNRTVTETLSPLENLGQDKKKEKTSSNGVNGAAPEEKKFDELELETGQLLRLCLLWRTWDRTRRKRNPPPMESM